MDGKGILGVIIGMGYAIIGSIFSLSFGLEVLCDMTCMDLGLEGLGKSG